MRYAISIMLGAVLVCAVCFAGENPGQKAAPAASDEAGSIAGPAALHLKIVQNGFQLNWSLSPQDPGTVTGYEIVRADRYSGPFDPVATVGKGTVEYIDTTASPEVIYYYKVRATSGQGHSPFSNMVAGER